ncbi:hypothetical protein [Actinoplanes friuliensis]|uniref:Ricin B lectin domain-containing protein n=1 Tax=Actinoplanes friuliensis DSM 7358 TaxID=1246995 RepID=U5VRC4_9ACTN|nr:hypothetical protein [Actinoplanes friuliensis]AGZ39404.1 hypothetical protein AFR_05575 [Actinoplanes friuliensis DSM 7358]
MHRTARLTMAAATITALTACGTATSSAPTFSSPPSLPPSPSSSPSTAPTTSDPDLVDADLSQLKNYSIDLAVPVVITTSADAGTEYHLDAHPDGRIDFTGTAVTETTRMTVKPAKVRKRTEKTRNTVMIVATPKVAGSAPESCVTDKSEGVLRMDPCRPGDATQSWRLVPAGDSGLFELNGKNTAVRVDEGKLVKEGGYSALQTIAVK